MKPTLSKTLILSPHLDDAVFSCFDFIRAQTSSVKIISVFTKFQTKHLPPHILEYIQASGLSSASALEEQRLQEDFIAMSYLGCEWEHLNYIDGGFRVFGNIPYHPTAENLFSGSLHHKEDQLVLELSQKLHHIQGEFDKIIIPAAIGRHIDHLIVRRTCEKAVTSEKILYYADFPYVQSSKNWTKELVMKMLSKKSLNFPSKEKKEAINIYSSQTPFLFPHGVFFPEIIIGHFQ